MKAAKKKYVLSDVNRISIHLVPLHKGPLRTYFSFSFFQKDLFTKNKDYETIISKFFFDPLPKSLLANKIRDS